MDNHQSKFEDSFPKYHLDYTLTGRLGFWLLVGVMSALAIAFPAVLVWKFPLQIVPDTPFETAAPGVGGGNVIDQSLRSISGSEPGLGSDSDGVLTRRQQLASPLIPRLGIAVPPNDGAFVIANPPSGAEGGLPLQTVLAEPSIGMITPTDSARVPGAPIETYSIVTRSIDTTPVTTGGPVEAVPFRYPRALPGTALADVNDNNDLQAPQSH